jgi:CBS domain-containing protein
MSQTILDSEADADYSPAEDRAPRALDRSFLREPIAVLEPAIPVCAERSSTIADVVRLMQSRNIGCTLIVDRGELVGIFTERDLLRDVVGAGVDPESARVDSVMTEHPEALRPTDSIVFALNKMSLGGFRHVPLVDESGRPVGIISVKDIVEYVADVFADDVHNVPPEPGLDIAKDRDGA